jgi:diguanylate cyclase (GGDEF)-like protein
VSTFDEQPGPVSSAVPDLEIALESVADAQLLRRQQLTRRVLAGTLLVLALAATWYLYEGGIGLADVVLAVALTTLVLALYVRHDTTTALTRNRLEREASIRRIVTGLSRSVSAESVVDTVIGDLRTATDADHVVVARVREDDSVEVTLVAARADAPPSRTTLRPEIDARSALSDEGSDEGVGEALGSSEEAAAAAEEIARRVRAEYGLPQTLATPLVTDRRFLGALLLARRGHEAWSDGDRRLLAWAANEVATAFARTYALEAAERGAKIDVLTRLPNRRYFDEALAIESPRRRANDSIGILMIDIDHFKLINDRFGHDTGDQVLRGVASAITGAVRDEDTPARFGGEEFAVLLRRTDEKQATEVAERIRRAVVRLHPASFGITEPVTVSVGVAVAGPDGVPLRLLVKKADAALYKAKRQGRDRVVVA